MKDLTEKTLSVKRAFQGRALTIDIAEIEMPDGRRSTREIVRHRGASVILGELPDGRFVWVRQYRRSIEQALLECVAGGREENETFDDCARREMEEESGYIVQKLEKVGVIVCCPGYSEERLHLYHALLSAKPNEKRPDFDENLETVILSADEINAKLDSNELIDGKSICLWSMWQRRAK